MTPVEAVMILDNPSEIRKKDPSGMLRLVRELPQQIEKALVISSSASIRASRSVFRNVVVGGMGGSAIAGDILRELMAESAGIPCLVVRDYFSPGFIAEDTLLFCSSYSGDTEETLSLYEDGRKKGATIVCVGSGGELENRALTDGVPFLKTEEGLPPRAAIGYSFFTMFDILRRMSILSDKVGTPEEVISLLKKKIQAYDEEIPRSQNPAKQLASALQNKIIVVYGTRSTMSAALRWKCQFNENSKAVAFANSFPELNHNEIVGWYGLRQLKAPVEIVVLRDHFEHPRISKRIRITLELIKGDGCRTQQVWCEGESLLTRIFSLIYLGDFASIYLAVVHGEDPTPVRRIEELKRKLSEESHT